MRYIMFIITLVTSAWYTSRIYKLNTNKMILEQKMIFLLSILTILFNDPFYVITITKPNYVNNFFSVMFVVNLLIYLFLFWITILDVN
jgi:hypothetical protein